MRVPSNRQADPKNRGGRPTLAEQAEREAQPLPAPSPDKIGLVRCGHCGHDFAPRVYRTCPDGTRTMRCDGRGGCGCQFRIPLELLRRLQAIPGDKPA